MQTAPGTARPTASSRTRRASPSPTRKSPSVRPASSASRLTPSANDGSFSFTVLPPGPYRLNIAAQGFAPYSSGEFTLGPSQDFALPGIALKISSSASITVTATPDQIAVAQVHEEEQQRVLFVFPNFYTSYIWNAQPMPAGQK